MDDKRLQSEFDSYFKGAQLPDNMTADAKAQVKPRKRESLKWIFRLAPVAAAFVVIVAISIGLYSNFNSENYPAQSNTYYIASLNSGQIDPYSAGKIEGLEFAARLAYTSNANVYVTAYYDDDTMYIAEAEITLLHNGYRHDTVLYAEFTDDDLYCEELKDFREGSHRYYRGYDYILNTSYDEGENVYTVYLNTGKVKYYLSVMTAEEYGYEIYLKFLENI